MALPNLKHVFPTNVELQKAASRLNALFTCLQQGTDAEITDSLRKFHDYSTRSSVVKSQGFHCDGTVYRTQTILASETPVIGLNARENWEARLQSRNVKISAQNLPIHIEHTIPIRVLVKYLKTEAGKEFAQSKRRLLEFVFFNSVLCCVSKNVEGIDEKKICDQNSVSKHEGFLRSSDLGGVLPFERYIGVSPKIQVLRVDFGSPDTWVPVDLASWTMNNHRAFIKEGFRDIFDTLLSLVLTEK